ncbi:hypothetical protein HBI97_212180 [Parastagonospora nodorum]|nr:hypothetical protein HBI97_212180 [Parastagonospora nodorum]
MNLPGARRRSTTSCKESAAAQSDIRERKEIENYAKRNSTIFITRDYTTIKLTRLTFLPLSHLADLTLNKAQVILLSQLLTNNRTTLCSTPKTAPLLVRSSIATMLCRNICSNLQTHVIRQARIEVTAAYALNYLELRVLKLTLVGTVLYNAIKEYYDDRTRKTIYFHSYTVENDYYDNDVDNILIKYIDDERQRYNTLIEDYNRAGKREDNILTIDECRTGYSNKKDIEADEREEETRVRLRKSLGEIHDILLREFYRANNFTESVTHNDDEQDEFAILAEEYMIDNRIIHALLEDCDALVERYEEEINCSDLYSTV